MLNVDIDTIIKIWCCPIVRIEGDKQNVEGKPQDLSQQFGSKQFLQTLDYYLRKNRVEVKLAAGGNYLKLNSAYYDNSGNEPVRINQDNK